MDLLRLHMEMNKGNNKEGGLSGERDSGEDKERFGKQIINTFVKTRKKNYKIPKSNPIKFNWRGLERWLSG